MAHQVFISYASADQEAAVAVCEALERAALPCWMAPRNIGAGTDFPGSIVQAIKSARVLVLILTEHAAASPHVLSEVGQAFNGRKRIVPFRLSSAALPPNHEYFLSMTQWLDAQDGCTEENLQTLVSAALDAAAGKIPPARGSTSRRRTIALAALIALPVLAAGGVAYWKWPRPAAPAVLPPPGQHTTSAPPAETWINPVDGETYVRIPAGTFNMGCSPGDSECDDDEKPAHPVRIDRDFWMGQTEVTVAAYRKFDPKHESKGDASLAVTGVTWAEAKKYCAAIGGRLPFEAEWEYAARAVAPQARDGVLDEIAWYGANSGGALHPVRMKKPNAFGLYDMLGNAAELVLDRYYKKYYVDSPAMGPEVDQPLAPNASATARGGSWDSEPAAVRLSSRAERESDIPSPVTGFRCAIDRP